MHCYIVSIIKKKICRGVILGEKIPKTIIPRLMNEKESSKKS